MVCPACWANKLFQIERNSRCLNRATWNISNLFIKSAPSWKRRGEEGGKKNLTGLPLFGEGQVYFHLQLILGIELQLHSMLGEGKTMFEA